MAKLFGGTLVPLVAMKCAEIMGGFGVTKAAAIQRIVRDAVTNVVAGGAPAVLRNSIAAQLFPNVKFTQTRGG
jgi:butyryl-CoA dehydrogenase